ncbi:hypothetical protein P8Q88_04730 [Qipengyuania sp. XHP0207]|uniref:hypothetical protein n=1 Tax=Qipengyuania sp. XHP0207 TaxID=3038078 RepID=UPI00241DBA52|nr:hypothetical protein [Qipengyuania sp. XHP0207]MDG5747478.1 hypothetical protein [Qipengyuania sp. XHP0207]
MGFADSRASCALLVALSVLPAGCGASDPEPAPEQSDNAEIASNIAGKYETTLSDGTVILQTVSADGTYRETNADGAMTETGRWRQDGANMCFDPEGDAPETCYSGGGATEGGVLTVLDANGEISTTVRRLNEEPGAPE